MAQGQWHKCCATSPVLVPDLVMQQMLRENLWVLREDKADLSLQRERKVQALG